MTDDIVRGIKALASADDPAAEWDARHKADGSHRPGVVEDGTTVGWYGQKAFAHLTGLPMQDRSYKADGDGGIDFHSDIWHANVEPRAFTVDVKTFRIPNHLICEQGKVTADIYVLAAYVEDLDQIWFLGWEWGKKVLAAPVRVFRGPPVHAIRSGLLRSMDELFGRLVRPAIRRGPHDDPRYQRLLAAQKAKETEAASTGQSPASALAPVAPPPRYPLGYTDAQLDAACADAERLGYRSSRVIADPDGWEWKNGSWVRKEAA